MRDHELLLKLHEDIEAVLASQLPAVDEEKVVGTAEIIDVITLNGKRRQTFDVAGCKVVSGKLRRGAVFQILRGDKVIHVSKGAKSLRHFKEKVSEIKQVRMDDESGNVNLQALWSGLSVGRSTCEINLASLFVLLRFAP